MKTGMLRSQGDSCVATASADLMTCRVSVFSFQ